MFIFNPCRVSVDEVLHQLQHLDVRKATGSDGVCAFFLKTVACKIAESLTLIFSKSLDTDLVPSVWKYCNVSTVHKGGDKGNPSNSAQSLSYLTTCSG